MWLIIGLGIGALLVCSAHRIRQTARELDRAIEESDGEWLS